MIEDSLDSCIPNRWPSPLGFSAILYVTRLGTNVRVTVPTRYYFIPSGTKCSHYRNICTASTHVVVRA